MKNKLAENMLRFGPKNLTESEVEKLQRLIKEDNSSRKAFIAKLAKIDPKAADVVENKTAGVTVSNKYVLSYVPGSVGAEGAGILNIHKVVEAGFPYIQYIGRVIDRAGPASTPDDITISPVRFNIKDYPGGYNEVWNSLDDLKTQDVIDGALQFIANNQEKFKKAFHKFSRSPRSIDVFWNDNPRTFADSQYALGFASKMTGNAKRVLDLVQDDLLLQHINFKVKKHRSDGRYPELKIPSAVG